MTELSFVLMVGVFLSGGTFQITQPPQAHLFIDQCVEEAWKINESDFSPEVGLCLPYNKENSK